MPVLVKDFQWHETKENAYITVPLKGVKGSKADIFCTEEYIKVSYPPFLFECLLFGHIDDDKAVAKIRDGCIAFTLPKKEPGMWTQLQSPMSEDKSFLLKKKQEAIDYAQKKNEKVVKEKATIKDENKKYSMRQMMKVEEEDRQRIEEIKESERLRTARELEEWKEKKRLEAIEENHFLQVSVREESGCVITELPDEEPIATKEIFDDKVDHSVPKQADPANKPQNVTASAPDVTSAAKEKTRKKATHSSGPRKGGKISINFTPRVFPTPQRESKEAEENEWLQKQSEARKMATIDDPDLAEHEKDPVWLKDKAGKLFASGEYLAAENAYNLAIRIQPKMPILYLNRAACRLKLRNLYKCIEDCSTALDLMKPEVEANAKGRLKGHLRRAAAFCELELYVEALQDYEAALKIDPRNEVLISDAEKIRTVIQSSAG